MRDEGKFVELFDILGATFDTFLVFLPRESGAWFLVVATVAMIVPTLRKLKMNHRTKFNLEVIKRSIHLIMAADKLRLADRERDEVTETRYTESLF